MVPGSGGGEMDPPVGRRRRRHCGCHNNLDAPLPIRYPRRTGWAQPDRMDRISVVRVASTADSTTPPSPSEDPGPPKNNPRATPNSNRTGMDDDDDDNSDRSFDNDPLDDNNNQMDFLRNELLHIESLEEILLDLEQYDSFLGDDDDNGNDEPSEDDESMMIWDEQSLDDLLRILPPSYENDEEENAVTRNPRRSTNHLPSLLEKANINNIEDDDTRVSATFLGLEQALMQGVVPVSAGVGSECLPGDFGFDPLRLADMDLIRPVQSYLLKFTSMLPTAAATTAPRSSKNDLETSGQRRPKALILRDYREAEIRHGRLAMLAAVIWPLQEMLDRLILSPEQFGPLLYGPVTLPYFPLFMTAIMMLLGYLDIYSQAIKDMDQIGEAFLPADCFWDPLQILQGAPERMKRNMQERELFNGRAAMIAVAAYILEEIVTRKALIEIESNALLLEPAYQVPFVQRWLDTQFSMVDRTTMQPLLAQDVDSEPTISLMLIMHTAFLTTQPFHDIF